MPMGQTEAKSFLLKSHIPSLNEVVYLTLKKKWGGEWRQEILMPSSKPVFTGMLRRLSL